MATTTARKSTGRASNGAARRALPPVTVARFEEAGRLLERLVDEQADIFLSAGQRYRDRHAEATRRELSAEEAAQVAAALATSLDDQAADVVDLAGRVQGGELRAVDQPDPRELLLAAGVATAPALVEVTRRFVALIEMPADAFEQACETDTLDEALEGPALELRNLELGAARGRARTALEHFTQAAGAGSLGEAAALLTRTVGSAFTEAMRQLIPQPGSASSSLTGSPPPTGGPAAPSSTTPGTPTP